MKAVNNDGHKNLAASGQVFAHALAKWFDKNARALPWRSGSSAYRTVVSEFMLQQTQVVTVLPYFGRWMDALPDFQSLAEASEALVLKLWEGLGYYNRARNLQKLARKWVAADSKPKTADEWLNYPGVGPYTAAAISSIAFGEYSAVVDGNVVRILARLSADATPFKDGSTAVKHFEFLAQSLIQHTSDPGSHNEAMMELGATVCLKNKPLCLLCPVQAYCAGHTSGMPEVFPNIQRKATIQRTVHRLWVLENGKLLLHQRAQNARRLAGLYELPEVNGLVSEESLNKPILVKKRGIANERIEEKIYSVPLTRKIEEAVLQDEHYTWIPVSELESATLTGPHRKWVTTILSTYG